MVSNLRNRGLGVVALCCVSLTAFGQFSADQSSRPMQGGARPPVQVRTINGKAVDWINGDGVRYRVGSITTGLRSYKQQYNQWGQKLHPGFPSDRLAVIELEVENNQNHPIEPPVFMAALTDTEGAHTTDWMLDTRQQAFIEESNRGGRAMSRIPATIGANQKMKLALVFSISPKARPTVLEFSQENFRDMPFRRPNAPMSQLDGGPRIQYRYSIDLRGK